LSSASARARGGRRRTALRGAASTARTKPRFGEAVWRIGRRRQRLSRRLWPPARRPSKATLGDDRGPGDEGLV